MKTINVSIGRVLTTIPLGRQGENEVTEIIFDCSALAALYGEGAADVLHRRPGDEAPYPCAITQEGNTVRWVITSPDVARRGAGQAELRWYVEDTLAKSVLYSTTIRGALACGEEPPEPWKAWVDQVLEAVRTGGASAEQIAAAVEAYLVENPVEGLPGPAGADGKDGVDGTDGYSPSVSVTQTDAGAVISITDQTCTTTATIANGRDGEKGDKGDPGDVGPQGPAGVNGTDGKDGVTPNLQIGTVETLGAGSDATASITGTSEEPLLNLGIPRGVDGRTPVRGTDYWTTEDIASIRAYVDEAILGGEW